MTKSRRNNANNAAKLSHSVSNDDIYIYLVANILIFILHLHVRCTSLDSCTECNMVYLNDDPT